LLAIGFYLGSDTLRRYTLGELATPRLAPSKGTRLRNMWGPIPIIKGLRVDGRAHAVRAL
jgi:hypothetical protein